MCIPDTDAIFDPGLNDTGRKAGGSEGDRGINAGEGMVGAERAVSARDDAQRERLGSRGEQGGDDTGFNNKTPGKESDLYTGRELTKRDRTWGPGRSISMANA